MTQLTHLAFLKMDHIRHTRALCVLACRLHHFSVNIITLDVNRNTGIYHLFRFLYGLIPQLPVDQICPLLGNKFAVHSRRDIRRHHRRLDRKRSTSAERINKNPVGFPRGQHKQSRRQRLCERCLTRHRTVSSFV